MQGAIAQPLRPGPRTELAHQLDIDAFLLEEAELGRRNSDEIRGRIQIGNRKLEHHIRSFSAVLRHSAQGRAEARSMASFEVSASACVMKLIGPPMVMAASCWRALISV